EAYRRLRHRALRLGKSRRRRPTRCAAGQAARISGIIEGAVTQRGRQPRWGGAGMQRRGSAPHRRPAAPGNLRNAAGLPPRAARPASKRQVLMQPAERHARHFQAELELLKTRLLEMGGLAEEQVRLAVKALVDRDRDLLQRVLSGDEPLNKLHIEI